MAGGGGLGKAAGKFGGFSRRLSDLGSFGLASKAVKAAGMNPNDPLSLQKNLGYDKKAIAAANDEKAVQQAILARQQEDLANLNNEENSRIKKMLLGGRYGVRGYRGSPLFRMAPGNSAGRGGGAGGSAGGGGGGGTAASGGGAQASYGRIGGFLRGGNFTGGSRF